MFTWGLLLSLGSLLACFSSISLCSRPGPAASLSLAPVPETDFEDATLGAGGSRRFGSS